MTDQRNVSSLDTEALREKYRLEREKRVTDVGRDAPELTGWRARYLNDPYTEFTAREAVNDEVDVIVVGAGFGGLLTASNLRKAGVERIRLIDMAGDVGGVWYWNRYPGCMCDVDSLIYLPLLEEMEFVPSQRYAQASEIFGHAQNIARKYRLYDDALFQTAVTDLVWQEDTDRWLLTTDRGDETRAPHVILANGPLTRLKVPDLPGLDEFEGHSFHTSRWDYGYTGGGPNSDLVNLHDKKVGIVGTGSTGLQAVPPLGRSAEHLYVFQRTPSTVAVRNQEPIDAEAVRTQPPGWQRKRQRNFTEVLAGCPVDEVLVKDGWTDLYGTLMTDPAFAAMPPEEAARAKELADFNRMESIRERVASTVQDPDTAEALKPYYAYLCKRPGFHDEYLDTFNRPNVTLVDTQGKSIERAFKNGVIVNGQKYELDCLIFATGFEYETPYAHRIGFEITGKQGETLTEHWDKGLRTLHGLMTTNFPNLFIMPSVNTQSVVTSNLMDTMQENAAHVAYIVTELRRRKVRVFEVDPAAEDEWVNTIIESRVDRTAFLAACTPGRTNNEGRIDQRPPQNSNYGPGPVAFYKLLADWRAEGDLRGLQLNR